MLDVKPSWKNWQLLTQNGRHIWAFKPKSKVIEKYLENISTLSNDETLQFAEDFVFDSQKNPNSADQVFRNQCLNTKFKPFNGSCPEMSNEEDQKVVETLVKGINFFSYLQSDEGHWPGDYGGPMFLLPGLLIASYLTGTELPKPHQELMKIYLFNHQNEDGGWGMHIESESTLFGTVMQYVALRILGLEKDHESISQARDWIKANGGATGIPSWGKFYLAIMNLYDWDGFNSLFPEMWLFPKWLPVHPSRYWCHSRMVYLPMAYCYAHRIQVPENEFVLSLRQELFVDDFNDIDWPKQRNKVCAKDSYTVQSPVLKWMSFFTNTYEKFHFSWARKKALALFLSIFMRKICKPNTLI
jgi:lanosterol synthase